nr:uncharacterized protein LOC129254833 [Lytechinus pictus]
MATGRVLILHIRGKGKSSDVPSRIVRTETAKRVNRHQRIHIQSCTLGPEEVALWGKAFPNVYFGFSALVSSFQREQLTALRRVPSNRLLVKTDAPHLVIGKRKFHTPA